MYRGQRRGSDQADRPYSASHLVYGRFRQRREKPEDPTKDVADIVTELLEPPATVQPPATKSSAMVLECLEVALAKLDREPPWRLAGSGFFDRTVSSMVTAVSAELQAGRNKRPWLLKRVEASQERLQHLSSLQAEEEERWATEDAICCRELEMSRAELQEAARCQRVEEELMQTTRATLEALKQRAHEAEQVRLEEQQRQREQLLDCKDGLQRLLGKLREEYDQDVSKLTEVNEEEKKLEYEREVTMLEVAGLSEVEEAITALEEQQAMLQKELQRLTASTPRGRGTRNSVAHKPSGHRPSRAL